MRDLLDTLQSLADGLECMSINEPKSGLKWAISEIKKLRAENETLKREVAAEAEKYMDEIARLRPTDAEREALEMFATSAWTAVPSWTAVPWSDVFRHSATLRGLLERLG